MEIATVNCASCGAPIKIPPDLEHFNCAYCGASLVVQRGEGYVALKLAEQVSKSIQNVGEKTQSTIREGTQVTQAELKRLQISQEISSLQIRLSSVQSEIRSLQRQKADRQIKYQLKELSGEEASLINQINGLQSVLAHSYPPQSRTADGSQAYPVAPINKTSTKTGFCASPIGKGCLTGLLVMIAGAIVCGLPAQALDQGIFHIPIASGSSSSQATGPISSVAYCFVTIVALIGFVYALDPKAKIWNSMGNWIKERIHKMRKQEPPKAASFQVETDAGVSETVEKQDRP